MWCSDKRNGLMMAGYSVPGTLAHTVLSEPKEIITQGGDRVPVHLSIHYISFSAHSDYAQTCRFVAETKPKHVVLVHGAEDLMLNLQRELQKQYDPRQLDILAPANGQNERDLCCGMFTNFIADFLIPRIDFSTQTCCQSRCMDLFSVIIYTVCDRGNNHLYRRQPNRHPAGILFNHNTDPPLQ